MDKLQTLNPVLTRWYAIPLLLSVIFSLFYGLNYGISNHNTYLLHGLRLHNPEILKYDWLASNTTTYHPVFSYLVSLMYSIDSSGWIFAVANILFISAGGIALHQTLKIFTEENISIYVFAIILGVWAITKTESVSASYLYVGIFQASTIAAVFFLYAILCNLRKKYAISSIFLAIGGLFHANYLILCFPLFFFPHLFMGRNELLTRLFKQFTLPTIALLLLLPLILSTASDPNASEARNLFQYFVAPIHYIPLTFLEEFIPFALWQVLALSMSWEIIFKTSNNTNKNFYYLFITLITLLWLATLLTTIIFIPAISQLYFWRLAPISDLISQIIIFTAIANSIILNQKLFTTNFSFVIGVISSIILVSYYVFETKIAFIMFLVVIIFANQTSRYYFSKYISKNTLTVLSIVIFLLGSLLPLKDGGNRSSLIKGFPDSEHTLYQWAKTNTNKDSVFLTSPALYNFRLHAQRAVIVDKKSTPILGSEMLEWYHRIEVVSGIRKVKTLKDAINGYSKMNLEHLDSIRNEYSFTHIIVNKDKELGQLPIAFENQKYKVLLNKLK